MSKIGIIIKREYLRRVSKKSFLLLTLCTPFLFALVLFLPLWLSTLKGDDIKNIAILDNTGKYAPLFENTDEFRFVVPEQSLEEYRENPDKEIYAFISITDDLLVNPKAATIYSGKQIPGDLSRLVNQTIRSELEKEKLDSYNIPNLKEIIEESKVSFSVQTIKWGADGSEKASSAEISSIIGMVFTILIYMFILLYGAMVMQGVMEEKTNRIIELIISSVKPFDLMMGKIIGILFVGLTQVFIWAILTGVLFTAGQFILAGQVTPDMVAAGSVANNPVNLPVEDLTETERIMGMIQNINFGELSFYFILYFIGGYLLFSSIFAAVGSAVDQQEDTQQFMAPITLLMVFALYAGIYSIQNPDGPLAFWGSMIPLTSPIVMMVRLPFDVPLWEKIVSVVILYATSFFLIWFAGKIYRIGILMYGKKPSIKEMIKWIRYK